jgi:hypothetical protein
VDENSGNSVQGARIVEKSVFFEKSPVAPVMSDETSEQVTEGWVIEARVGRMVRPQRNVSIFPGTPLGSGMVTNLSL